MKILMVCLGNICRSPLAEALLQSKISPQHVVDSAGTSGFHKGNQPDTRSIAVAKNNGLNMSNQKSRPIVEKDLEEFDLIYAMDSSNYRNILALDKNKQNQQKVHLILNEIFPGENRKVPDPYFGEEDGFLHVFDLLDQATDAIVRKYNLAP